MESVERKVAVELGLTRYYTGKPCKHGHIAERKTASGQCAECARLLCIRWKNQGRSKDETTDKGKELPSLEYLKELFTYHPDGYLIWNIRPEHHFQTSKGYISFNSTYPGKVAGYYNKRTGYITVNLNGTFYKGHRLIYKLVNGVEPSLPIDHIDGNVLNNKIENLREVTVQENAFNADKRSVKGKESSVYKGVQKDKRQWVASIKKGPDRYRKGFATEIEAALWYDEMALELFGEFAKLNFPEGLKDE